MTPRLRRLTLTAHVASSVGWLGSVLAYLAVAIAGLTSRNPEMVRAAYPVAEMLGWFVIVPLSLAALLTGLIQSLASEWGLFRHYWVSTKFVLTIIGVIVLIAHMQRVDRMARLAVEAALSPGDYTAMRASMIVHAAGGAVILLITTALSIYKPWGRTRWGRRARRP